MATPSAMVGGTAVWGTSTHDLYLGDYDGRLFHFDGTTYTAAFSDPSSDTIDSIYESPSGSVYVVASELFECSGNCASSGSFTAVSVSGCRVSAVCGSGESVAAVGTSDSVSSNPGGCLLSKSGGSWSSAPLSTMPGGALACVVEPNGTVDAFGNGLISSYSAAGGETAETINWPTGSSQSLERYVGFVAAWTDGTNAFAAGGDRRVLARGPSGWSFVLNDMALDPSADQGSNASFTALAGATGVAWAFGTDVGTNQTASFDGTSWTYGPTVAYGMALNAAWAADSGDIFVVGGDIQTPLILHGHH